MLVFLNDRFIRREEAAISAFDRGFLYGDGVFETLRAYSGNIFMLEKHLDRLAESADMIRLALPYAKEEIADLSREIVARNSLADALIRITITRGESLDGLDIDPRARPTTVITARPFEEYPHAYYAQGVSVVVVTVRRVSADSLPPRIKSLNFLNNILAKAEARRRGAFDGILLNHRNHLTEATTSNLFLVSQGELLTPSLSCGILAGITREHVLNLARRNGIPSHQRELAVDELYAADECFLTNTSMELMPVTHVDGRAVGSGVPGPVTSALHRSFREDVARWLERLD